MLAHAEEGLPFFNPIRTYQISSHIWQDIGLGFVNPFTIPRITLYAFSAGLSVLKIPVTTIQQLVFILLILAPLVCIPLLTKLILPESSNSTGTYAALFYVFNLFFISQVLQRFILELFFLWSYLPLFTYLWIRWLESTKIKHLALLTLSSIVYSYTFTIIASVFALWISAGIVWWKYKKVVPAVIAITVWLLATIWWWYPLFSMTENPFADYLKSSSNFTSLVEVSKYYPNAELILLKQKYYFGPETKWFTFYSSKPASLINRGLIGLSIIGLFVAFKQKNSKFLVLWLVIGWFLVKGANPPWGAEFYKWLFNIFPFTQVLRNPYEKLGVVFLLPYCLFMALGLSKIPTRFIQVVIVFVVCFGLLKPMWTGQVFAGYQVEVPPSYKLADLSLNAQSNLRLLHLPFLHGSGVEYNWGYLGDEPSEFIFGRPSISKTYFFPNDPYMLMYQYLRSPKMYRLMQFFAIDTLVIHKDYLTGPTLQENYEGTKSMTSQIENLKLINSFDALDIYQLVNVPVKWGYLSTDIVEVESLKNGLDMVVNNTKFTLLSSAFSLRSNIPHLKSSPLPRYQIIKHSPIHYQYQVFDSSSPYFVILSTNFSSLWIAKINDHPITDHFQINGFANGWLVDQKGDYTIDVKFKTWPWE